MFILKDRLYVLVDCPMVRLKDIINFVWRTNLLIVRSTAWFNRAFVGTYLSLTEGGLSK